MTKYNQFLQACANFAQVEVAELDKLNEASLTPIERYAISVLFCPSYRWTYKLSDSVKNSLIHKKFITSLNGVTYLTIKGYFYCVKVFTTYLQEHSGVTLSELTDFSGVEKLA